MKRTVCRFGDLPPGAQDKRDLASCKDKVDGLLWEPLERGPHKGRFVSDTRSNPPWQAGRHLDLSMLDVLAHSLGSQVTCTCLQRGHVGQNRLTSSRSRLPEAQRAEEGARERCKSGTRCPLSVYGPAMASAASGRARGTCTSLPALDLRRSSQAADVFARAGLTREHQRADLQTPGVNERQRRARAQAVRDRSEAQSMCTAACSQTRQRNAATGLCPPSAS